MISLCVQAVQYKFYKKGGVWNEKNNHIKARNFRRKSKKNRKRNEILLACAKCISCSKLYCDIGTSNYTTNYRDILAI